MAAERSFSIRIQSENRATFFIIGTANAANQYIAAVTLNAAGTQHSTYYKEINVVGSSPTFSGSSDGTTGTLTFNIPHYSNVLVIGTIQATISKS